MLTAEGCIQRRQRLWDTLDSDIQWVLIADPRHVQYFCNFRIHPISFSADQRCLLLLTREGKAVLLADNFARRTAAWEPVVDDEVIVPWYTHQQSVSNRDHALLQALEECRSVWSSGPGLIESERVSAAEARLVMDFVHPAAQGSAGPTDSSVNCVIRQLRRRKHSDEVELLNRCMRAGDAGHAAAFDVVRPGVSELDVYLAIQQAAEETAGCPCIVYGDFRATNRRVHKAGGLPTDYVLQPGDLLIADFSVVLHGYRSDFTNTIAVGPPDDDQVRAFEACRDALQAAASELKPGASGSRIYEAASDVLQQRGFPALAHHCGHGLGLEHPEPPILVPQSSDTLIEGDVVTIEPGLYIEGVGGMRFEHNYLISKSGSTQLSGHRIGLQSS